MADASEPTRALIDAAEQGQRLTQSDAAALRSILQALHDFDALDDFIDKHAAHFEGYTKDREQRLEWTSLHNEYSALVEGRVQARVTTAENQRESAQIKCTDQVIKGTEKAHRAPLIRRGFFIPRRRSFGRSICRHTARALRSWLSF